MSLIRARLVLRVANIDRSLRFYCGLLGCAVEWREGTAAVVRFPGGSPVLLADPEVVDTAAWTEPGVTEQQREKAVYVRVPDVRRAHRTLVEQGARVLSFTDDPYDPALQAVDPDGYQLFIWMDVDLTDAEVLELYAQGPALLEEALAGLSEADLDLQRAPGKWSIRQTVLHLVDEELNQTHRLKFALAEPGREYRGNPIQPDTWVGALDYARRPIGAEVALFRALREHALGLANHLEGALDRANATATGQPLTVREGLRRAATHAWSHIQQIRETREVHDR